MSIFTDLTGMKVGKLTVLKRSEHRKNGHIMWTCLCQCGVIKDIGSADVKHKYKSCGCGIKAGIERYWERIREQEKGMTYNGCIVLEYHQYNDSRKKPELKCQCHCGNIFVARASHIRVGAVRSCGCLKRLQLGEACFNRLYSNYQRRAKERNLIWNIGQEEFLELTSRECFYCGLKPSQIIHRTKKNKYNGSYTYNGIDRVNNALGYEPNNCVPCCKACNWHKGPTELTTLIEWVTNVYHNFVETDKKDALLNLLTLSEPI